MYLIYWKKYHELILILLISTLEVVCVEKQQQ